MFKMLYIAALCYLVSGCALLPNNSPKRNFPSHIKNQCYGSLNRAESVIKSVGVHVPIKPHDIQVVLQPGIKNYGSFGWSFIYEGPGNLNGVELLGICVNGKLIHIGVNPNNNSDVNYNTLDHEMGHHWLSSNNFTDMFHYPIYDAYFEGWKRGREFQGKTSTNQTFMIKNIDLRTTNDFISAQMVIHL